MTSGLHEGAYEASPSWADAWARVESSSAATPRSARRVVSNLEAFVRVRPAPQNRHTSTVTLHDDQMNVTVRLASARSGPLYSL